MGGGSSSKLYGGGNAAGNGIRRFRARIHGCRVLGGGDGIGKVGSGGSRKLGACGGQIEGHKDRFEGDEGWILVRGRCIERAGLRINSQGEVYAPDSEDEGPDMEMEDVAAQKADAVMVPATRSPTIVVATDVDPATVVAEDGASGMEVAPDGALTAELAPEVQARLDVVLADIDPVYHVIFINLYKVMVPAFFKSN